MKNSASLFCPLGEGFLPRLSPGSTDILIAALAPAYLLGLLASRTLGDGLDQLGYLSEQILQGRRLPVLNIHEHPSGDSSSSPNS